LDSAITRIDPARGPIYRGCSAVDLAQSHSRFEEVASRLWRSSRPAPWTPIRGVRVKSPTSLWAFTLSVASLGFGDAARTGASREDEVDRASGLMIALAGARARGPGVAEALLASVGATRRGDRAARAVDCALVLSADHELNASTFAARVAASAGADLNACLVAALATLSGRRHGGECDRVEELVREVGAPRNARSIVLARTKRGHLLPGFGHPLYPDGDPRAPPLLAAARALAPAAMRTLDAIVGEAGQLLGLEPSVDVGLVAIAHAIGVPSAAAAIFALGRCAGWTAHVIEQREAGFLLRPRARYVGP
jgi:citrate synthase